MRIGHWLGSLFCATFSALTLMAGRLKGRIWTVENRSTNTLMFSTGIAAGGGAEMELDDLGSPGKIAIKWK